MMRTEKQIDDIRKSRPTDHTIDAKVSKGNTKMGRVLNFNLPAVVTCRDNAPCIKDCYACKGTYRFRAVKQRYKANYEAFQRSLPVDFANRILEQIPASYDGLFRWHSSGDIPNETYLSMMAYIARQRPLTKFLAFTKQYEIVNDWMTTKVKPVNLNIVFSAWDGLEFENPNWLPVAYVNFSHSDIRDTYIPLYAEKCSGDCVSCGKCWDLHSGQAVYFDLH